MSFQHELAEFSDDDIKEIENEYKKSKEELEKERFSKPERYWVYEKNRNAMQWRKCEECNEMHWCMAGFREVGWICDDCYEEDLSDIFE